MPTLHLIYGFIGAGKTTFAKKLSSDIRAIYFCHDEWMHAVYGDNPPVETFDRDFKTINSLIFLQTGRMLDLGYDVILDYGAWERARRDEIRAFASSHKAEVKLYHIDCPEEIALKRTLKRTENIPHDALFIDENAYFELKPKFEPLGEDEPHIYVNTHG